VAVGGTPLDGHNPARYLDAEFESVEVQQSGGTAWHKLGGDEVLTLKPTEQLRCRAVLGNTAEAAWLAPESTQAQQPGAVYLCAHCPAMEKRLLAPIIAGAPYLGDAVTAQMTIPLTERGRSQISLQLQTTRKTADGRLLTIPFGEQRLLTVEVSPSQAAGSADHKE
jgi:hypothetical protein